MDLSLFIHQLGFWADESRPLHQKLALAIQKGIQQGILMPGTRLPAERKLAQALALSRTTVVTTYDTLRAQGWLESRPGSGTWVASDRASFARQCTHNSVLEASPVVNLLLANDSERVDFAAATTQPLAALPPELFSIGKDMQRTLLQERSYMPLGLPLLKHAIAQYYMRMGVPTDADQILVTAGAQQAISLVTGLYVQRGDTIVTENPTYFGALQTFRLAGARLTSLNVGPRHVDASSLRDRIVTSGPRMVYLTPTHHNPTGAVMPEMTRRDVARLSEEFGVPIVEDCTLADLSIEQPAQKPIAAFAGRGTVISIGSLSKLYWASLRVGWLRAPVGVISQLARLKSTMDLGCPLMTQVIASQLLSAFDQARALRTEQLTTRRDLLVDLLREHFPQWSFSVPSGGLCLWVHLDASDARHFSQFASRHGVALAPGSIFAADESYNHFLRIPFLLDEHEITRGVLQLKAAWGEFRCTASVQMTREMVLI